MNKVFEGNPVLDIVLCEPSINHKKFQESHGCTGQGLPKIQIKMPVAFEQRVCLMSYGSEKK
jgi:hypothetical protein